MRSTDPNILTTPPTTSTPSMSLDTHGMRIDAERGAGDVVQARIAGEVDLLSAPELRRWVQETVPRPGALVLELDGITFLGSAGLSVLAELAEQAASDKLKWAIVATKRVVLRPLEATGLVTQMPVYGSMGDALDVVTDKTG